jgi:hypothetical protein
MRLEVEPAADDADRGKLASAFAGLLAWATALRGRMEPGQV